MAQYPKTTGALVTVNIRNANKAGGDGRMKLDAQLIEMFDIMLPVAELKTMMSDEVDAWISKMAEYGQEWCEPDGRLLKCTDYPELFALIGYNYGWSNTNPNGTSSYSFTDNNGASKSLVIYNDLDIDGNALPVVGTPAYFRLPNLAGRFLRCAGTASYVNKWTDTDGTVRQLLTEYKAEMYRGQLDAQRGISGEIGVSGSLSGNGSGAFSFRTKYVAAGGLQGSMNGFWVEDGVGSRYYTLASDRMIPTSGEIEPISMVIYSLLRIA